MGKKGKEKELIVTEASITLEIPIPSRGRLLNQWAAKQEKMGRLQEELAKVVSELTETAQALYTHYGVLVQDTTRTVALAPRKTRQERAPGAEQEPSGGESEEGGVEPTEPLRPEDNPLARSPVPILVDPRVTQSVSEEIGRIRKDAALGGAAGPAQFGQDVAESFERAVRLGLGKRPGRIGPG